LFEGTEEIHEEPAAGFVPGNHTKVSSEINVLRESVDISSV